MHLNPVKVKELRLDRGWTQEQLANGCGLSTRTIQRIEKDGIASLETTSALVAVFEVQRVDLLLVSGLDTKRRPDPSVWPLVLAALFGLVMGVGITILLG